MCVCSPHLRSGLEGLPSPQSVDHDRRWVASRATHVDSFARWCGGWGGHVLPREPRRRFESMEAALRRIEGLLEKALSASRPDTGLSARLRRDRLQLSHSLCDIRSAREVLIIRSKR